MKVILNADSKIGKKGDIVNVADGYARNYLFPKNLALEMTSKNVSELNQKKESEAYKISLRKKEAQAEAKKLNGKKISLTAKAGENNKFFGSITKASVAEQIKAELKFDVDKKKIEMDDIKEFGTYDVKAKLFDDVIAEFKVEVKEEK
ncbi:MAG: 50S ribosomal protein L9 [Clostridia bacterium]|nr:50S ribosomal protein L9 [Clostridia bacterium]